MIKNVRTWLMLAHLRWGLAQVDFDYNPNKFIFLNSLFYLPLLGLSTWLMVSNENSVIEGVSKSITLVASIATLHALVITVFSIQDSKQVNRHASASRSAEFVIEMLESKIKSIYFYRDYPPPDLYLNGKEALSLALFKKAPVYIFRDQSNLERLSSYLQFLDNSINNLNHSASDYDAFQMDLYRDSLLHEARFVTNTIVPLLELHTNSSSLKQTGIDRYEMVLAEAKMIKETFNRSRFSMDESV